MTMLGFISKFVLATLMWLGCFEPHLIMPLQVLPVSAVLDALHASDYLLWLATFFAIEVAARIGAALARPRDEPTCRERMPRLEPAQGRQKKRAFAAQSRGFHSRPRNAR